MNLHGIVKGAVGTINPQKLGTLRKSTGYATIRGGDREPTYEVINDIELQVQALMIDEIRQLDAQNLGNSTHKIYLEGQAYAVSRPGKRGGDILVFDDQVWLITSVMESWPDWSCVSAVLQMDAAT